MPWLPAVIISKFFYRIYCGSYRGITLFFSDVIEDYRSREGIVPIPHMM